MTCFINAININDFKHMIEIETDALSERARERSSDILFRPSKSYDNRHPETIVRESFNSLISSGWSLDELVSEYGNARSYYGLMLFSSRLLFIRHTAGFAVLPLLKIKEISLSKSKAFMTKFCTLTVSYEDCPPDEFDFLFDGDTLRGTSPSLEYEELRYDLNYAVMWASRKAAKFTAAPETFEDSQACEDSFNEIAAKEYAFLREVFEPLRKGKQTVLFGGIAAAVVFVLFLFFSRIYSCWFLVILPIFWLAEPWEALSAINLFLASGVDGVLMSVKKSIVSGSRRYGIECRELCDLYNHSQPVGNIALINDHWLILRRGEGQIAFIDLDDVMGFYFKESLIGRGRGSFYRYYLMFRFFDGLVSFFEIGDKGPVLFSRSEDYETIKGFLQKYTWVSTSSADISKFKTMEEFAFDCAKKRKAFYDSIQRV